MKRLISVIILAAICLTALSSCKKSYEPVESTEEESRVVMTVSVGEHQYDVRYELAMSAIEEYYIGKADEVLTDGSFTGGAPEYTYEDIERYYYSDSCARVLRTYLAEGVSYDTAARAESVRQDLVNEAVKGESAVAAMMINRGTPTAADEILSGVLFGEHSSADEYQKLAEVAPELNEGEVSEVVYLYTASDGGRYYILYRAEKTDDFLESSYSEVVYTYLYDSVGKMIDNIADLIADGMNTTDSYLTIDHASISMDR